MNSLWINRITLALAAPGLAAAAWGAAAWGAADIFSDQASLPPPQRPVRLYKEPDSLKQVEGLPDEPAAIPSTNLKGLPNGVIETLANEAWGDRWTKIWSQVKSLYRQVDSTKEPASRDWIIGICNDTTDDLLIKLRKDLQLENPQDNELEELEELEEQLSKLSGVDPKENLKGICDSRKETLLQFEKTIEEYAIQVAAIKSGMKAAMPPQTNVVEPAKSEVRPNIGDGSKEAARKSVNKRPTDKDLKNR